MGGYYVHVECPTVYEDEVGAVFLVPYDTDERLRILRETGAPGVLIAQVFWREERVRSGVRTHFKAVVDVQFLVDYLPQEARRKVLDAVKRCYERSRRFSEVIVRELD